MYVCVCVCVFIHLLSFSAAAFASLLSPRVVARASSAFAWKNRRRQQQHIKQRKVFRRE